MSMINVTNLTFGYEGSYDNVFENVSFQIDTDWKLGFTGRQYRPTMIFVEHDIAFQKNIATEVVQL